MTEARANEILRTKYPEARIYNGKRFGGASTSEMVVVFHENGKAYNYQAQSYADILNRLGFCVLYKHDVAFYNKEIARLEKEIEAGGENNKYNLFIPMGQFIQYSDEQLQHRKDLLKEYKETLATAIVE